MVSDRIASRKLEIVAGLSLRNLKPHIWDAGSPFHIPDLEAVMVSWADFNRMPSYRRRAMSEGLHSALSIPSSISIYLDNGAFNFAMSGAEVSYEDYEEFVRCAKPDWYAIPQDFIPTPKMTDKEQRACLDQTMDVNSAYSHDGYVPVVHISRYLSEYIARLKSSNNFRNKQTIALGGIVPNLLRMPKAMSYDEVLSMIRETRMEFSNKKIHVFGIGGTATLHVAALLGIDSVDSSGWRNRAARGIVQLQGCGDRMVANLGKWRGRELSSEEHDQLSECLCPSCEQFGIEGLAESGIDGFCKRATHNLWTLVEEVRLIESHTCNGTYADWYKRHLNNSTYRPLVDALVKSL